MQILPKSIENVGGFIFNYRVKNVPYDFSLHRLMLDIKDNALKAELGDVFEKCPSELGEGSLRIDFMGVGASGGTITVNKKIINLLRIGDFYSSGEENLPIIKKLVELSKAVGSASFEFKNNLSEMKDSVKKYNFEPTCVFLSDEPNVMERFADEVTTNRVYDSRNAKYVSSKMGKGIHNDVLHYFGVI